jgi:hypothetical protein
MSEWASWTCATCCADMDDPVTISATTCSNGHVNYLGPVLPAGSGLYCRGAHRRAFATRAARAQAAREDKRVRDTMRLVAKAWEKSRLARARK